MSAYYRTGQAFGGEGDTRRDFAQSAIRYDVLPSKSLLAARSDAATDLKLMSDTKIQFRACLGTVTEASGELQDGDALFQDLSFDRRRRVDGTEPPHVFMAFEGVVIDLSEVEAENIGLDDRYRPEKKTFSVDSGLTVYGIPVGETSRQAVMPNEKYIILNEALMIYYAKYVTWSGHAYASGYGIFDKKEPKIGVESQRGGTQTLPNTSGVTIGYLTDVFIAYPLAEDILKVPTAKNPFGNEFSAPGTAVNMGVNVPRGSVHARLFPVVKDEDYGAYRHTNFVGQKTEEGLIQSSHVEIRGGFSKPEEVRKKQKYDPRRFSSRRPVGQILRAGNSISNVEIHYTNTT